MSPKIACAIQLEFQYHSHNEISFITYHGFNYFVLHSIIQVFKNQCKYRPENILTMYLPVVQSSISVQRIFPPCKYIFITKPVHRMIVSHLLANDISNVVWKLCAVGKVFSDNCSHLERKELQNVDEAWSSYWSQTPWYYTGVEGSRDLQSPSLSSLFTFSLPFTPLPLSMPV